MQEPHMNFIAIVIATLIPMIMGFIYYNPSVFGKYWMNANGFKAEDMGKGPKPMLYLLALGVSFLFAMFLWGWVTGAGGQEQGQVVDPKDGHSFVTFKHGVVHGIIFRLNLVITHRGGAGQRLAQQVITHNHNGQASGADVFLRTGVNQAIFAHVYRARQNV